MRKLLIGGMAALAAITFTPLAHANPSIGDSCVNWHATTTDNNGNTLVCTHLADSGHMMYWEYSIQDRSYRTSGFKTACPGLTDGVGNNTAAAHNACCVDSAMAGRSEPGCGAPAALPPAPAPAAPPGGPERLPCLRSNITICPPGATLPPGVSPPPPGYPQPSA